MTHFVKCVETGEVFKSSLDCAKRFDISPALVSMLINGQRENKYLTLTKITREEIIEKFSTKSATKKIGKTTGKKTKKSFYSRAYRNKARVE